MTKKPKLNADIVSAIALTVAGVLFAVFPASALSVTLRIAGAFLCAVQGYKLYQLFKNYERTVAFPLLVLSEGLVLLCGIILLINPGSAVRIVCAALGAWLAVSSVFSLFAYSKIKKTSKIWFYIAIEILELLIGIWLIFFPSSLASLIGRFLGIALIIKGVSMLTATRTKSRRSGRQSKNEKQDYISTDFKDKSDER